VCERQTKRYIRHDRLAQRNRLIYGTPVVREDDVPTCHRHIENRTLARLGGRETKRQSERVPLTPPDPQEWQRHVTGLPHLKRAVLQVVSVGRVVRSSYLDKLHHLAVRRVSVSGSPGAGASDLLQEEVVASAECRATRLLWPALWRCADIQVGAGSMSRQAALEIPPGVQEDDIVFRVYGQWKSGLENASAGQRGISVKCRVGHISYRDDDRWWRGLMA
jgi:hypothetical protein